jgi:hypothetical protein
MFTTRSSYLLSIFALIVCGCSIEVAQPIQRTPTPLLEEIPATSSTSLLPATQVPVSWGHLNLTGRLIYISSTRADNSVMTNIQMLDLGTGIVATLFQAPESWVYYATVSPDAKTLIISYAPPEPSGAASSRILYTMALNGTSAAQPLFTPPTPDDRYTQAEWSPDGKFIYYTYYNNREFGGRFGDKYKIFRMTYPAGEPELIAEYAFWPRLSSDATRLVYIAIDPASATNTLFVSNADGSNPQSVTISGPWLPDIIDAPIFSPDGESILFSAPTPASTSYQPNWFDRLTGIQIAMAHNVPSDWWSVPVSGGAPTQLTNIQTINLFASLSPDQQHIASVSGEGLFVMDLDGSNLTRLISDPGIHGTVRWVP